jgi:hypothetical protein
MERNGQQTMKILYLDCFSGLSGDMTLAALVDAGADRDYIEAELSKITIEPFRLEWKRVVKRGLSALKMDVLLDPNSPPKHHRHYSEIVDLINRAGFSDAARSMALAIFEKIAIAEAKIHNVSVDTVHFHEVGAIDSIVDVIGVALAIDSLHVDKIIASPVPLGSGTVVCGHGTYPVPAPATLEMMRGLPIAPTAYSLEMTTPTGAGIIAGLVQEFAKGIPPMIVETIGYGAGTRDLPTQPNVLRIVIGQSDPFVNKFQAHHEHLHHEHPHDHAHSHHEHNHSHAHDHSHSKSHSHDHGHNHDHDHSHTHDHSHKHHDHDHDHHHAHSHDLDHEHDHKHDHSHKQHHDHDHDHHDAQSHDHDHDHTHDHSHKHHDHDDSHSVSHSHTHGHNHGH